LPCHRSRLACCEPTAVTWGTHRVAVDPSASAADRSRQAVLRGWEPGCRGSPRSQTTAIEGARFRCRVTRVRHDLEAGLRPATCRSHALVTGHHDVIPPLDDEAWDVADAFNPIQELVGGLEESAVPEVVALDACQGVGHPRSECVRRSSGPGKADQACLPLSRRAAARNRISGSSASSLRCYADT